MENGFQKTAVQYLHSRVPSDDSLRTLTMKNQQHFLKPQRLPAKLPLTTRIQSIGWWWWELGALLIASCCTLAIVVILFYMHDRPLDDWNLAGVQPNSLVAVFSTITKSALLFAIAECLGQLKWQHYEDMRALGDMAKFDSASRGPWGSTTFLFRIGKAAVLPSAGAAVTVLMLGFEPFTQQGVGSSTRNAILPGGFAIITMAKSFMNNAGMFDPKANNTRWQSFLSYPLTSGILGIAAQGDELSKNSVGAYCSSVECRFPDYTSLAACTKCEIEPVHIADFNCTGFWNYTANFNTAFSSYNQLLNDIAKSLKDRPPTVNMTCVWNKGTSTPFPIRMTTEDIILKNGTRQKTVTCKLAQLRQEDRENIAPMQPYQIRDSYHDGNPNSFRFCGAGPSQSYLIYLLRFLDRSVALLDPQRFGQINGTMTRCSIDLCAKKYTGNTLEGGYLKAKATTDLPLTTLQNQTHNGVINFTSPDTEGFQIEYLESNKMINLITDITGSAIYSSYAGTFFQNTNGNFSQLFFGVGDIVSRVLQSPHNAHALNVTGDAYGPVVFVEVQWVWFLLPLCAVLAAMGFLGTTMWMSRKREFLFKTSILPVFLHGLDEKALEREELRGVGETLKKLMMVAEGTRVRLGRIGDGMLKSKGE
ncbi:hypothetical protein P280DRAFT_548832 [Massarina eburnea CBS 473.64]|uniref:Uncharacterized protein n=1 Tax=Massarina eburnea CBS 473.64 TaxID=1395130 RepID=A0A6A6S1Q6_9PLEO|nr:hypothetical protein P280DRAFT_548832 [Massarina eburnea CBS 473.64]